MDMSYIMDFAENYVYITFPNIFSLISADSADLSKIQKKEKKKTLDKSADSADINKKC